MNDGVLITDGDSRIALSVLRSLARRNIEPTVAAENLWALSFFSRYCKKRILCPSSKKDLDGFLSAFQNIVKKGKFDVLFPVSDWSLLPISEHREWIKSYVKLPLPSHESVKKAYDKSLTMKSAIEEGIPVPKTFFVCRIEELKEVARKITYPAVIKPRWSWVWKKGKALYRRPTYVNSASELLVAYKSIHENFSFPLVQEYVPGKNVSVAVLFDHCQPKAACCIKVYRAMPVTGGTSVFRESVRLDPEMKKYVFLLLKALEWHGIAEVEFKIDSRDSMPKLMEVNARFWASLEVAIGCGVDFPYLLYRLAMDGHVKPVFSYRTGVKFRWLQGDVQYLLSVLKGEPRVSNIPRPGKLRTIFNFFKLYEKDMHYDCFSPDDPLPFASLTLKLF